MSTPALNLVVLRTNFVHSMLRFYSVLGLKFVEEKHGCGPIHYACELGTTVIEIYPKTDILPHEYSNSSEIMLGFRVQALDPLLGTLREIDAVVVSLPHSSEWGRRAVVQDPDGRRIELTEVA